MRNSDIFWSEVFERGSFVFYVASFSAIARFFCKF
jgi:hypothetical protein